jgi:hypothetical protein
LRRPGINVHCRYFPAIADPFFGTLGCQLFEVFDGEPLSIEGKWAKPVPARGPGADRNQVLSGIDADEEELVAIARGRGMRRPDRLLAGDALDGEHMLADTLPAIGDHLGAEMPSEVNGAGPERDRPSSSVKPIFQASSVQIRPYLGLCR